MFQLNKPIAMVNKLFILGAALAGCTLAISALVIRQRSRHDALLQHKEDLRTWEGEGGKPAPVATRSPQAL
jgi:hypothetical protein